MRSFNPSAENQEGPKQYSSVPSKGLEVNAAVYPFPKDKFDSGLNGIGFTAAISKSAGSFVTFDDGEEVGEYSIGQSTYNVGVHYRHNLASLIAIDGSASYGHSIYKFPDVPTAFETPDTDYSYFGLGGKLDLNIANKATVGFGGRYMYILDTGDVTSEDFFGPGRAWVTGPTLTSSSRSPRTCSFAAPSRTTSTRSNTTASAHHRGGRRLRVQRHHGQRLGQRRHRVLVFATPDVSGSATCRPVSRFRPSFHRLPANAIWEPHPSFSTRNRMQIVPIDVAARVARRVLLIGCPPPSQGPPPCPSPSPPSP